MEYGKTTDELRKKLGSTHPSDVGKFLNSEKENMLPEEKAFSGYMRSLIREKGIMQQEVFLRADIPERYGYKLLAEEKKTRQRDVILRICYAAGFTLAETQKALRIYEMPELYARHTRDAIIMIAFNERPGSVIEVNALLKENGQEPLRTSGTQE